MNSPLVTQSVYAAWFECRRENERLRAVISSLGGNPDDERSPSIRQGTLDGEPCAIVDGEIEGGAWFPTTTIDVEKDWIDGAVDLCHAVAGDLAPANRILAATARRLLVSNPTEGA